VPEANEGAAGSNAGRTFIILNPAAGQDEPERLKRALGGGFAARDAAFDLVETAHAGHAATLAGQAAREGYRAVAVVGGDGTIAEAASGLAGTTTPLAILPRGTANQVAQNLAIPIDLEAAIEVAVHGCPSPIDLGRIGGRAFALVAGAGFDAAVMAAATRELKERWGFAAYVYAAVKEALAAKPRRFHIRADGRELEVDAVTVMIANVGELFPAYLPIRFALGPRPTNSWQDGLFDVIVVAPRTPPDFAMILWRAAHRNFPGDDRLIHFQTSEITIDADPPIAVQIDGDPAGVTPITATVERRALHVLLPESDDAGIRTGTLQGRQEE
jgi:YegS/Rv2252/BmrU family lipid kinase